MTSEIKQRIEQIKNGQVPQGYKKTKVGIVPSEWEVKKLEDICYNFDYGMNAPAKKFDGENKYIRITDIDEKTRRYLYDDVVSPNIDLEENFLVKENDILFSRTGASTGKTYLYNKNDGVLYFAGFLIRLSVNKNNNSYYIFQNTMTDKYTKWIMVTSMRSGQPGVNAQELKTYSLPIPPLQEQQKIADILSTQDKVIELKEKLIEEKQKQKKYLMQNLLTGKIRLNGFSGEWKKVKLGDICNINKGEQLNKNTLSDYGKYYVLNGGIVPSGYTDMWNREKDTISISEGGNSCGFVNFNREKFWSGGHCYTLKNIKNNIFHYFLYFCLKNNEYKIMNLRVGSGLPNIQKISLLRFGVLLPPLEEQKAIAEILSTQDKEIELLQKELEEEKQKKKALMQLLLTGIVRV